MKCYECEYYRTEPTWNACSITMSECFRAIDDCALVNDDGSINYEDEFFNEGYFPSLNHKEVPQ